ncbi:hypothetical protein P3T73_14860 [Kiritimatiellota bacterium B12222]|nr:hypothetical protein P3T73_14860 [Kiritimatiellota bacterium B12222]
MNILVKGLSVILISAVTLPLCIMAALVTGMTLPYIQNWPYTGLVYGVVAATLAGAFTLVMKSQLGEKGQWTLSKFILNVLLLFLILLSMVCLALRVSTEKVVAYAFDEALIREKVKNPLQDNLTFYLRLPDGEEVVLDGYDPDLWGHLKSGDEVRKEFRQIDLQLLK